MDIIGNISSDGFCIFQNNSIVNLKNELDDLLMQHAKYIINRINPDLALQIPPAESKDLTSLLSAIHKLEKNNEITKVCYEIFPSIPTIVGLMSHPDIQKILTMSGVTLPQVGGIPSIRLDRPHEDFRLTPWHQDIWYSMLSEKSIVIWFPIQNLDENMGPLHIIRGSHKLGIVPFQKNDQSPEPFRTIENYDAHSHNIETISLKRNQILVFNQHLLHK